MGVVEGVGVVALICPLRLFGREGGGPGDGPASGAPVVTAGLLTSVPVAAGAVAWRAARERLPRDPAGMNEQLVLAPAADVSVNRSPLLRARSETIVGVLPAEASPTCSATAV